MSQRNNFDDGSNNFLGNTPYIPNTSLNEDLLLSPIERGPIESEFFPQDDALAINVLKRPYEGNDENYPNKSQRTDNASLSSFVMLEPAPAPAPAPTYEQLYLSHQNLEVTIKNFEEENRKMAAAIREKNDINKTNSQTIATLTETNNNQQNELRALELENSSQRDEINSLRDTLRQKDALLSERERLLFTAYNDRQQLHSRLADIQFQVGNLIKDTVTLPIVPPAQPPSAQPFEQLQKFTSSQLLFHANPRTGADTLPPGSYPTFVSRPVELKLVNNPFSKPD